MATSKYKSKFVKPYEHVLAVRVERAWSVLQQAIFNWIENYVSNIKKHLVVVARAGSGKTTTIVEALYHCPKGVKVAFFAFNKSIADELATRAPAGVDVMTLHKLGLLAIKKAYGNVKIEANKSDGIARSIIGDDYYDERQALIKTASLAKGMLAEKPEDVDTMLDKHGIDTGIFDRKDFIPMVFKMLDIAKQQTSIIDFDDMIWFPCIFNMKVGMYDWSFIDEAQDLNKAQIKLALSSIRPNGHIVCVGDDRQALYQFRGADEKAIANIIEALDAAVLPLSVTYRCGKEIVKLAQKFVPDYEAGPNNPPGEVLQLSRNKLEETVKPGDFVLSRINAPLVGLCLSFLKAGIPSNIAGRDMGKNLIAFIKKSKSKTIEDLMKYTKDWQEEEYQRLAAVNRSTDAVDDKAECIFAFCENAKTVAEVLKNIENMFADTDDNKRVVFSTVHRAKGLERNRVFMLSATFKPGKSEAEDNIFYVAVTRAKDVVYMVSGK